MLLRSMHEIINLTFYISNYQLMNIQSILRKNFEICYSIYVVIKQNLEGFSLLKLINEIGIYRELTKYLTLLYLPKIFS